MDESLPPIGSKLASAYASPAKTFNAPLAGGTGSGTGTTGLLQGLAQTSGVAAKKKKKKAESTEALG